MTTKKDLSDVLRQGMQKADTTPIPQNKTTPPKNPEEVQTLKLELEKEQNKVRELEAKLQAQQAEVTNLEQALEEKEEKVTQLEKQKKQFIVPVGIHNYLVIAPATSTVLTDEEIGWFD